MKIKQKNNKINPIIIDSFEGYMLSPNLYNELFLGFFISHIL